MQTPDTIRADQAIPFGLLLAFLVAGLLVVYISGQMRKSRLSSYRSGRGEASFVSEVLSLGCDLSIGREAYLYLQKEKQISFPILPEDRLDRDLRLNDADVCDLVNHLLRISRREPVMGQRRTPLITVQDVLRHVQNSPVRHLLVA